MDNRISESESNEADYQDQARKQWIHPSVADAWSRWHGKTAVYHAKLTRAILMRTGLFVGANVLDLASGVGEPAMTIARQVGLSGKVTAVDISPDMIAFLKANSMTSGIDNLDAIAASVTELPFESESFDIVTCKLGAMFFVPIETALQEAHRILRPGGRAVFLVWGMPEQGNHFKTLVFPFLMRSKMEMPSPDSPSPFRFAAPRSLSSLFEAVGFVDVREEREVVEMSWPGSPEEVFQHLYDIASPLRAMFDSLDKRDYDDAYQEAMTALGKLYDGQSTLNSAEVVVVSATR